MTDEKFIYQNDLREKKSTARSARNRRTHNGKPGAVRMPSDNLTRKELKAMNGDVKSYRLNEPMGWEEFRAMPDDVKVIYIKALQKKYNIPATALANMFGVNRLTVDNMIKKLGIEHRKQGSNKWDKEAFLAWSNGVPAPKSEETEDVAAAIEPVEEQHEEVCDHTENTAPCSGFLTFEGSAEKALSTTSSLLGCANVRLKISWELLNNG